jgi:hypothetical protein
MPALMRSSRRSVFLPLSILANAILLVIVVNSVRDHGLPFGPVPEWALNLPVHFGHSRFGQWEPSPPTGSLHDSWTPGHALESQYGRCGMCDSGDAGRQLCDRFGYVIDFNRLCTPTVFCSRARLNECGV